LILWATPVGISPVIVFPLAASIGQIIKPCALCANPRSGPYAEGDFLIACIMMAVYDFDPCPSTVSGSMPSNLLNLETRAITVPVFPTND
jgi:hypothetical protein